MRGEEILGFPVAAYGKTWQVDAMVTPADAKLILLAMPLQRPVRKFHVERIAAAMKAGKWMKTHQGIAFDTNGLLIDGQHRLNAIIDADVSVPLRVNFNEPTETFAVIDRHEQRILADDLVTTGAISGSKESKLLAAAIRVVCLYDAGVHPAYKGALAKQMGGTGRLTSDDAAAALDRHPHIRSAVAYALSRKALTARSFIAGLGALFMDMSKPKAIEFLDAVLIGDGVRVGDPAYTLREFLTRGHALSKDRGAVMVAMVRSWNAFVEGRKLSKVDTRLATDAIFPRVAGLKK